MVIITASKHVDAYVRSNQAEVRTYIPMYSASVINLVKLVSGNSQLITHR